MLSDRPFCNSGAGPARRALRTSSLRRKLLPAILVACVSLAAHAGTSTEPALTSPTPGSTLPGSTVSFSWSPASGTVLQYQLWVGTRAGSDNLGLCAGRITSCQLTGLPTNGTTVHVMLTWDIGNNRWDSTYYTFSAASPVASVRGLSCASGSLAGAATDACTVTLTSAAKSGGLKLNLTSSNTAVTVPGSVTVPSGATSAGFTATAAAVTAAQTAALTATGNGASASTTLQLNASVATLAVNGSSIAFGDVDLNTTATQSVTLTSSGTAPLTIKAAAVAGTGFSAAGISFPVTLNPSQTATLQLQFDPTAAGAASGSVTISSNASNEPTATIALSGTGASISYQVALTWDASAGSADPVAGYRIYRATSSGSWQLLNASPNAATGYADDTVQGGATYSYEVTSVDAESNQSAPSNVYTATIP